MKRLTNFKVAARRLLLLDVFEIAEIVVILKDPA